MPHAKFMPKTIGAQFAVVMAVTVLMLGLAGFFAGKSLLTQVAKLVEDETLVESLNLGRTGLATLNKMRRLFFEQEVRACDAQGRLLTCHFSQDGTQVSRDASVTETRWVDEKTFLYKGVSGAFRARLSWPEYRPQFETISNVLARRDHLATILPNLVLSFNFVFGTALALAAILGLGVHFFLSRRIALRVGSLIRYTRVLARGELTRPPAETLGSDEVGTLATALDAMATDLDATRQRLILSEKMNSWQNVARKVAHEIKNPLTPISLVAHELRRQQQSASGPLKAVLEEASRVLEEETASLGRMVNEFSAFARLPAPKLQEEDLGDIVRDFIQRNVSETGPLLEYGAHPEPYPIAGDASMLRQILHNLVNNARLAKLPDRVAVRFSIEARGEFWVLAIADNGPGVPENLRTTLFDAYVTSRSTGEQEKGMGLGLTISRKIAVDHGGQLNLKKASSLGSVFELLLPRQAKGIA